MRSTQSSDVSGLDQNARSNAADHLVRSANGDTHAFSLVYEEFAPIVNGLITRVLRDRAQAEEVAQEVFLELWRNAARFSETKGSARTWILTMAHRRAVDRVRASQASRDRDLRIGVRDYPVAFDDVSERVEVMAEHDRVKIALARLSSLQRDAISATYYDGLSASEAANRLGVPVATLKTRLRDGLIRLRVLVNEQPLSV